MEFSGPGFQLLGFPIIIIDDCGGKQVKIKARSQYLILIVLIVVFAAGFFIVNSVFASGVVFSLRNGEEISSIMLTNDYGMFFFSKDQNSETWTVEADGIRYSTHAPKMILLVGVLGDMPVRRILESEKGDYGFKHPVAVVAMVTNKGNRYEYSFGRIGTDVNTVYAKNMSGTVALTDSTVFDQLTGNLAAYRNKKVFSVDLVNIKTLEYLRYGQSVINCYRESATEWYMDFPWTAPARHIELTEFVASMLNWIIAGYPETAEIKESGLDPPLETLILTDNNGNRQTINFGKIEGLYRYVQTGEQGDVVSLYAADVDLSILSPDILLFIAPLRSQMDQVSGFSVKYGNDTWTFSYDELSDTAFWDYGILSSEEFVSVFFKFISMIADGRDTGAMPQLKGAPVAVLLLDNADGIPVKLELFSRDDNTCFMRINGEDTPYYINAIRLSALLDRIVDLAARKSKTTPRFGGTGGKA